MQQQLFYSKKTGLYYFNNIEQKCDTCHKQVLGSIIIKRIFSRKEYRKNYYCINCIKKSKTKIPMLYEDRIIATITNTIPKDAVMILDTKPSLTARSDMDTFEACYKENEGVKIIDKTRCSGRDNGIALNPPNKVMALIEAQDKAIETIDEGIKKLDDIFNSQIYIEQDDKKLLEHKNGGNDD